VGFYPFVFGESLDEPIGEEDVFINKRFYHIGYSYVNTS